jgi:hypothetical protein
VEEEDVVVVVEDRDVEEVRPLEKKTKMPPYPSRERDVLVSVVESLTTRREIKGICWSEWKLIRRNKVREKRTGQLGMKWKWKWKWKIQYYYFVTNE